MNNMLSMASKFNQPLPLWIYWLLQQRISDYTLLCKHSLHILPSIETPETEMIAGMFDSTMNLSPEYLPNPFRKIFIKRVLRQGFPENVIDCWRYIKFTLLGYRIYPDLISI